MINWNQLAVSVQCGRKSTESMSEQIFQNERAEGECTSTPVSAVAFTTGRSVYIKFTPSSPINIPLSCCRRPAHFQESKGGFNNNAVQQIAGTVDDQWGWGGNSSLL